MDETRSSELGTEGGGGVGVGAFECFVGEGVSDGKKTCLCFHESGRIDDIGTAWHGMECSPLACLEQQHRHPTPRSGRPPVSVFRWTLFGFLAGWMGWILFWFL